MSKSSKLDRKVKTYILKCIEYNPETGQKMTINESLEYVKKRFYSEYSWNIARIGESRALCEWLQGLALNIAYMNYDILILAKKWGSIPEDASEKQEDKILENYWVFMANKLSQLMRGYRIPKNLTLERFAEYYQMNEKKALKVINKGYIIYESQFSTIVFDVIKRG